MTRGSRHVRLFLIAVATVGIVLPVPLARAATAVTATTQDAWVASTLASMTVPEKVGQLFVVNAAGHSAQDTDPAAVAANQQAYGVDNFAQLINRYHLGGIIYFGANVQNPSQVLTLSNGIQQAATSQRVPVPALISTDQEGGLVVRLGPPAAVFPGNMALGATRDTGLSYQNAAVMGQELRAVGVNVDLAPVVDVNTNPLNTADGARAFSDQTGMVNNLGAAQVTGFQNNGAGVGATAKHFPGLGSSDGNTDLEPVVSNRTLAELRQIDLPPFTAAIAAGTQQVMMSHLTLPNVDPSRLPASLSPTIVTGLLRNEMHFDGVVITDALQAKAITSLNLTPAQVAVAAVNAGDDQLLEQTPDTGRADLDAAFNGVVQAVQSGQITTARLDQSVTRILREKWQLGLVANPFADPARLNSVVGIPSHLALAQQTAERSITLLKNTGNVLPLRAPSTKKVLVAGWALSSLPSVDTLANGLAARGLPTTRYATAFHPTQDDIDHAVALARQNDVVIASTYNVWGGNPQDQTKLVEALVATGKPVIVVAQNTPYDIAYLPGVAGFLSVWSYQAVSLNAAVRVLVGEVNPTGRLPVTVTQPPPSTTVLYPFGSGLSYGP